MRILLIVILLSACVRQNLHALQADLTIMVKGIVVDSVSGKGVSLATIQVENNGKIVRRLASDDSGNFSFVLNTPGKYSVMFHSVGYHLKQTSLVTNEAGTGIDFWKISMTPSNETIKEVTVTALKPLVRSEAEKLVYNAESDPEAATGNALDILRKVPLVSVDGQDNVQLRGMRGVKFLINGKTSSMLDLNLKEVLRSMTSSTIRDIEVITSPSSKYEAEGASGIINIITSRKIPDGYNGRFSAGINHLKSANANLYFASKIRKFIYSANLAVNHWNNKDMYNTFSRDNFVSSTNRYSQKKWFGNGNSEFSTLNTEASYQIDSLNLISFSLSGRLNESKQSGHTEVNDYDLNHIPSMEFQNWFNSGGSFNFLSGNIDYQKSFRKAGNALTVSWRYDYSPRDTWSNNSVLGKLNFRGYQQKISTDMKNYEGTLQVDYVSKIGKKQHIEAGYKQIWRTSYSGSGYLMFDQEQNIWIEDILRINDLDYKQRVLGIYLIYDLKFRKSEIKAGLRGENTVNNGNFTSQKDTTFKNQLFNLVPYLLFSSNPDKGKSIKLSYTQRLARPGIGLLNPFRNDADPQNIRSGNPELETEVSHNFDLSFNRFSQKYNFSINVSGAFSGNQIVGNATVQPNGIRFFTFENMGEDRLVQASVFGSSQITKKWNINASAGVNYHEISSNTLEESVNSAWNYNGKMDITFKPINNSTVLAGAGYNSGFIYFQIKNQAYYWYYLSFQQDFLKKKLKLEARLENPLEKYQYSKGESFSKDFSEKIVYRYPSRIFAIRISYNFGAMKDQVRKARTTIRNDDLKQGG